MKPSQTPGASPYMSRQVAGPGSSSFSAKKQSFPEVISFLSNPFQRNNLNYAVKNNQKIITPKEASGMRFNRSYRSNAGMGSKAAQGRAKSYK